MKLFDDSVLKDAIDIHIHVGPDYNSRYADAITLAEEARAAGMKAIVIKCHLQSTVMGAEAANLLVPEVKTFGSLTLNDPTGGLSPRSVMAAVKSGAKVIWLPTVDSKWAMEKGKNGHWIGHYTNGSSFGYDSDRIWLTALDENGNLKNEVKEIVNICQNNNIVLCSGHLGPNECIEIAKYADSINYHHFEITHANDWYDDFNLDVLRELAKYHATISLAFGGLTPHNGRQDPKELVEIIHGVGADHCIMMTDFGQPNAPSPVEGFRVFYYLMKKYGITSDELDLMMKKNPAKLLWIDKEGE